MDKHEKQLLKLRKAKEKPQAGAAFVFLFLMLAVVYIVDEIASNMTSTMQPYVIFDLFKIPGANILSDEYASALSTLTAAAMPGYAFYILLPFYKSLADRIGRKPMLIINTLGLAAGMFVCMIANNFVVFVLGMLIIQFMMPNDMQVIYIMETAPSKHRAKLCSVSKAIALVSVSLIGVLRSIFYNPAEITSWKKVYLVPVIIGVAVVALCIPFVRETPAFIDKKIALLEGKKAEEEKPKDENGGFINAIRYIFKNKQLRFIAITCFIFYFATGITSHYATVLEASTKVGMLTKENVDTIIIFFPLINGIVTFLSGFLADALGRKKASIVLCGISAIGIFMFVWGARSGWNPYLVGAGYGLYIGGLWSTSDTLYIMLPGESTPTNLRSSVIGAMSLFAVGGMAFNLSIGLFGVKIIGAENLGTVCLCICLPAMIAALLILTFKVRETRGADLDSIGNEETVNAQ